MPEDKPEKPAEEVIEKPRPKSKSKSPTPKLQQASPSSNDSRR